MDKMTWQEKIKRVWPYALACIAVFYLLPIWAKDTGTFMVLLLALTPFICFSASLLWGMKAGRDWYFPIFVGVMYIPAIFIFYNSSAWIYSIVFGLCSLAGILMGNYIMKKSGL